MARWRTSCRVGSRPAAEDTGRIAIAANSSRELNPEFFRNNRIKPKVIQDDVSKLLPPGFKAPVEEQELSINKIFPSVKPTEAVAKDFKTSKVNIFF